MDLTGRVAVVTGASTGIGEATARRLAAVGMRVVAVARRKELLDTLAARQPSIRPVQADVTSADDVAALAAQVARDFGACHLLVNNAGVRGSRKLRGPADVPDLEHVMDVNFYGTVRCTAAFAELLFASAPAQVVNIGSVAGKLGIGRPSYHASKFATVGLSEALDLDWRRRGVVVTQLNPGFVHTEGFPQDHFLASPARRLIIGPDEVAAAVLDVVRRRSHERTVPRWYRAAVVARHVAAPLFWPLARRAVRRL